MCSAGKRSCYQRTHAGINKAKHAGGRRTADAVGLETNTSIDATGSAQFAARVTIWTRCVGKGDLPQEARPSVLV